MICGVASQPAQPIVVRMVLVTEQDQPISHYVADDEAGAPLRGRDPRALCGQLFRPACLCAPLGALCSGCAAIVSTPRRPGPPRLGFFRRYGPTGWVWPAQRAVHRWWTADGSDVGTAVGRC